MTADDPVRAKLDEVYAGFGWCEDPPHDDMFNAIKAVLDTIQHWEDKDCDHGAGYCVCGQFQLRAKIATALGIDT